MCFFGIGNGSKSLGDEDPCGTDRGIIDSYSELLRRRPSSKVADGVIVVILTDDDCGGDVPSLLWDDGGTGANDGVRIGVDWLYWDWRLGLVSRLLEMMLEVGGMSIGSGTNDDLNIFVNSPIVGA